MYPSNTPSQPSHGQQPPPSTQHTSSMEREYEFFVTMEEPHQPDGPERGLIRRLVMRNFFETRWTDLANNSSAHNSASTVQSKTKLMSRFRLRKPGREASDSRSKPKNRPYDCRKSKGEGTSMEKNPKPSRKLSGQSADSEQSNRSGMDSRTGSPVDGEGGERAKCKSRLLLRINPNAHRFDPFDVLPIPGTPQLDMLFKLYKRGSRTNSIAINARNTWWSFISNDAGLLHATLATWALYGMLVQDVESWQVAKLKHKSEAIKQVNTKIGSPGGAFSDELVGIVLTLASFENLLGEYDAAQLHIAALRCMVNARGGLFAFGHNDGLIRGMIWVDFHTSAAFHTPPSFPQIRLDPDMPPLPEALLEEAAYSSPTTLLQLSLAAVECFNIFYRLHRLALAISHDWFRKVDRLTISNMLYETEYMILSVPDFSKDFLCFDIELKEDVEDYEERARLADGASVVDALLAAVQIFMYASLRELPPKARIFSILLDRLYVALDRPNVSIIEIWTREKNLNLLLWVFVIGGSIARAGEKRGWWIGRLAEVVKELGIRGELELERRMQRVAWTDIYFGGALSSIWKEIAACSTAVEKTGAYQSRGSEDTTDPRLLEEQRLYPVDYDEGRWKVNGWYV